MYCVYKHTVPNGKIYIGITGRKPSARWKNGNGYVNNNYFWKAIQKYGWDNIRHDVIFEGLTKEEACQKEIELIAFYKSNQREYGYNVSSGGELSSFGFRHTEEAKQRIRKALTGRRASEELRAKLSEAHKGKVSPNKGKKFSAQYREALSKAHKGKPSSRKGAVLSAEQKKKIGIANSGRPSTQRKKIKCIETGAIYSSIHEAAEKNKLDYRNLSATCRGVQKSCGGYHWGYADV